MIAAQLLHGFLSEALVHELVHVDFLHDQIVLEERPAAGHTGTRVDEIDLPVDLDFTVEGAFKFIVSGGITGTDLAWSSATDLVGSNVQIAHGSTWWVERAARSQYRHYDDSTPHVPPGS